MVCGVKGFCVNTLYEACEGRQQVQKCYKMFHKNISNCWISLPCLVELPLQLHSNSTNMLGQTICEIGFENVCIVNCPHGRCGKLLSQHKVIHLGNINRSIWIGNDQPKREIAHYSLAPMVVVDLALSIFITCDVITYCYSSRNKSVPYV